MICSCKVLMIVTNQLVDCCSIEIGSDSGATWQPVVKIIISSRISLDQNWVGVYSSTIIHRKEIVKGRYKALQRVSNNHHLKMLSFFLAKKTPYPCCCLDIKHIQFTEIRGAAWLVYECKSSWSICIECLLFQFASCENGHLYGKGRSGWVQMIV